MPLFNKQDLISELIDRTDLIVSNVQGFLRLSNEQLCLRPAQDQWSIAEIFDHLNKTHEIYFKSILRKITSAPDVGQLEYRSGWLGDRLCDQLLPGPGAKSPELRAHKISHPVSEALDGQDVMRKFLQAEDTMHDIIRHASTKNLQKIRIPYSFTGLIKLRLGDCLRYLVAYSERYVLEARQIQAKGA
jgi:hypothetical protein